jgi:hypothetical protein
MWGKRKGKERTGKHRKEKEIKGKERKGEERKGKERKEKERKGKKRKGKKRKEKERKGKKRKEKERKRRGKTRKERESEGLEQVSTLGLVRTLFAPCSDLVKFAGHLQPKADSSTPPNLCFYIPMQHAFTMGLAPEPTKTQIQRRRPHGFFTIGFPFMKCNQTYSIAYMFMTPMKPAFTMGFAQ